MSSRHTLLAVAVAAVWGINFVVIHVGLESFPPLLFAAVRFAIVALPAVFFVARPDVSWKAVVGVGLFTSTGQFALLFVAIEQGLPVGLASLVLQVVAVFTVALAVGLLGERLTRAAVIGAAVSFAGIAVIALGRGGSVPLFALALCIAAAASWACGNIVTRKARSERPISLIVWSSLVPPIPLAALSLGFEGGTEWSEALTGIGAAGLLSLGYIVALSTFFGYGSWNTLLSRYDASVVAPFTLLVPVVGIASAWLALGEAPNLAEGTGAVIVLGGVAVTTGVVKLPRTRRATEPAVAET